MGSTMFKALRGQTLEMLTDQLNKHGDDMCIIHYVSFDEKTRVWNALVEVAKDVQQK